MYISFAQSYIKFLCSFLHYGETIFHSLKSFTNLRKLKKTKPKTPNQTDSCQLLFSTFSKRLFNFFPENQVSNCYNFHSLQNNLSKLLIFRLLELQSRNPYNIFTLSFCQALQDKDSVHSHEIQTKKTVFIIC